MMPYLLQTKLCNENDWRSVFISSIESVVQSRLEDIEKDFSESRIFTTWLSTNGVLDIFDESTGRREWVRSYRIIKK